MTYVLDRDGLAACPDDPMRVSDAIEQLDARVDELAADFENRIDLVIKGFIPLARINGVDYGPADIYERIFMPDDPETMRLLMNWHRPTKERLIRDWCYQQAELGV